LSNLLKKEVKNHIESCRRNVEFDRVQLVKLGQVLPAAGSPVLSCLSVTLPHYRFTSARWALSPTKCQHTDYITSITTPRPVNPTHAPASRLTRIACNTRVMRKGVLRYSREPWPDQIRAMPCEPWSTYRSGMARNAQCFVRTSVLSPTFGYSGYPVCFGNENQIWREVSRESS